MVITLSGQPRALSRRVPSGAGSNISTYGTCREDEQWRAERICPSDEDDPAIDRGFSTFLAKASVFKEIAGYDTGPEAIVPRERAAAAIGTGA
jgi:hypothetical protein